MAIIKSPGVTNTERLLAELCERSFLKFWSYPNPFKEDKKELCDLLAVFGDHVFIFFDRESLHLKRGNEISVSWNRWKRAAIDDQVRTAHGAEGYIKSGRKIFIDNALTAEFPININPERCVFHKIVVAHGAAEACREYSESNIYGSLAIEYGKDAGGLPWPFIVELDKERPVHILDSHNLPIILGELDTFFDLSSYFDAKVEAIKKFDSIAYCGEEDLLAHYFLNFDSAKNCHFIGPTSGEFNVIFIGEGEWKDFRQSDVYRRKKEADKVSYFWDELLQRTCQNALEGTLQGTSEGLRGRSALHEMVKEPRFSRRALASAMIQAIKNFPDTTDDLVRNISFMPSFYQDKAYVFLQLKKINIADYENDYRPKRQALLEIACGAAKNKFPNLRTIIGIGMDAPKFSRYNAEDFLLMDCSDWPEERRLYYEHANDGLNFFGTSNLVFEKRTAKEFPTSD